MSSSRLITDGMAGTRPQPLAFSEIIAYHRAFKPDYALADFIRLVQATDRAFLDAAREKQAAETPKKATPAPKLWVPPRR